VSAGYTSSHQPPGKRRKYAQADQTIETIVSEYANRSNVDYRYLRWLAGSQRWNELMNMLRLRNDFTFCGFDFLYSWTHEQCYVWFYGFTALTFLRIFFMLIRPVLFETLAGIKAGRVHLCRVAECDPIWQVTSRSWKMEFPLNMLLYLFWRSIVHGKIDWMSNVARSIVRRPNVPWSNGGGQMSWTRFTYLTGMEGWVDLGYPVMEWSGVELATSRSPIWLHPERDVWCVCRRGTLFIETWSSATWCSTRVLAE